MTQLGFEVTPMSRVAIRQYAVKVRGALVPTASERVSVERLLEFVVPQALPGFFLDILEGDEMQGAEGLAVPVQKRLCLRSDVYDRLCGGEGRARFTAMHELGHILLHQPDRVAYARSTQRPPAYRNPEWQADNFAVEFLMPVDLISAADTPDTLIARFGVSRKAADFRIKNLRQEGLLRLL